MDDGDGVYSLQLRPGLKQGVGSAQRFTLDGVSHAVTESLSYAVRIGADHHHGRLEVGRPGGIQDKTDDGLAANGV